jgi:hypothetical protein
MMDRTHDRDDTNLRVLIETMQRAGRTEHEIETAVIEASGRAVRDAKPTSRHLIRFALPRRARKSAGASR